MQVSGIKKRTDWTFEKKKTFHNCIYTEALPQTGISQSYLSNGNQTLQVYEALDVTVVKSNTWSIEGGVFFFSLSKKKTQEQKCKELNKQLCFSALT